VKGYSESNLSYNKRTGTHDVYFKVSVNEVTTHFQNNWIFMAVVPNPSGPSSIKNEIEPFIVDKIIIRSKIPKKKNDTLENTGLSDALEDIGLSEDPLEDIVLSD